MTSNEPQRCIYSVTDMTHFINSPIKRDLLSFVTTLGRSTISSTSTNYTFDPSNPLIGLSPGMASLHGSLSHMSSNWIKDIPPDVKNKGRFGNPMFKEWHRRLMDRSFYIIKSIMDCHVQYVVTGGGSNTGGTTSASGTWDIDILTKCSHAGEVAASTSYDDIETKTNDMNSISTNNNQHQVIIELQSHFHQCFGHEIRLDYGTGHECSFYIFLFILCQIGIFGNVPKSTPPSHSLLAPVALSITNSYLNVCRGIQTDYMLEPAGSHGVWGLDDYHCIPFYIGSCQLQNESYETSFDYHKPNIIHKDYILQSSESQSFLYFTCIRYIKELKKNVPFFESSPMLNDISQLSNWGKVSGGLIRLFEGEVLNKKPVVQHFMFGDIFKGEFFFSYYYHSWLYYYYYYYALCVEYIFFFVLFKSLLFIHHLRLTLCFS